VCPLNRGRFIEGNKLGLNKESLGLAVDLGETIMAILTLYRLEYQIIVKPVIKEAKPY